MTTAGFTIALLPGLLCDEAIWEAQRLALSGVADVVVADLSGFSSIPDMASSVLSSTTGRLAVFGHSMGGRVALEIIRQQPDRVVGLALIDTGYQPRRDAELAGRQRMVDLGYAAGMAALAREWLPPMVDARRHDDQALLGRLADMVARASPEQNDRQIRALIDRPDAGPGLAAIRCPTLVMVGRQDQWSPVVQHEELASRIPGAELVVIEDSGHMSLAERPAETTAALLSFVERLMLAHRARPPAGGMRHWLMICRHRQDPLDLRSRCQAAHREYMASGGNGVAKVLIGSALENMSGERVGNFGIMEAASREDVIALAEQDPFSLAGLVESVEVTLLPAQFQAHRINPMTR